MLVLRPSRYRRYLPIQRRDLESLEHHHHRLPLLTQQLLRCREKMRTTTGMRMILIALPLDIIPSLIPSLRTMKLQ